MDGRSLERAPEFWELAVRVHVLMCYPDAPEARRQRICKAIGRQMVDVTLDDIAHESDKDLPIVVARLSGSFPDYDAGARRGITERFVYQNERVLRVGAIVLALIAKEATGRFPSLAGGNRQPTLNEAARYVRHGRAGPTTKKRCTRS